MRIDTDSTLTAQFGAWKGGGHGGGADWAIATIDQSLHNFFPISVRDGIGGQNLVGTSLFSTEQMNGKLERAGVAGYAKKTDRGYYVLVSTVYIEMLWRLIERLLANPGFRQFARMDAFDASFAPAAHRHIVLAGAEYMAFHEMGHIMSGHCDVTLGRMDRDKGQPAFELEADLFAAIRMAENTLACRFQIMPGEKVIQDMPSHYFAALSLMGAFSAFALMAVEDQAKGSGYPPFRTRYNCFCNEVMVEYSENGSHFGKSIMDALGLVRFASKAFPFVLREMRVIDGYVKAIDQFSIFEGSYIDEVTSDMRAFMTESGQAVRPYQEVLGRLRPGYMEHRKRRTNRLPWDFNW